jgi:hypothetical protein
MKIAILYSTNEVYAVNQSGKKDFHGRYKGEFYKNSFILEE